MAATMLSGRASLLGSTPAITRTAAPLRAPIGVPSIRTQAARPMWLPGSEPPAHLDGSLPGDFGWDPLGLGANKERLTWFAEAERVHARWAMLGVAGIMVQEVLKPDIFWYDAPTKIDLPFNVVGLVLFELVTMHWLLFLMLKRFNIALMQRGYDIQKPNSQNQDPIFSNYSLPDHTPGYPGGIFAPFIPGDLEELKLKEIKNGRLAMLAFVGFTMAAQVTGKGPLAALSEHLADPINTSIFSKAVVVPGSAAGPSCAIPPNVVFQGLTIPTPCVGSGFWP